VREEEMQEVILKVIDDDGEGKMSGDEQFDESETLKNR
jgi:hypothetical protein